jgi:hypothetical protein
MGQRGGHHLGHCLRRCAPVQDASQVIVSTDRNLISATRVSVETRAVQWIGQMAEATIQQLSRDQGSSLQKVSKPQGQKTTSFEACGPGKTLPKKGTDRLSIREEL